MNGVEICHRLFDGIEQQDATAYDETCTPDAVLWQGHRPTEEKPFIATFQNLGRMHKLVNNLRYADRHYELLANGDVLLKHALSGTTIQGKSFAAHMLIRVTLKNGKVSRLDQVVDTTQLQAVYEVTQAAAQQTQG